MKATMFWSSVFHFFGGESSSTLMAIERRDSSLPYYYSAIFYIYCGAFLMYILWSLMFYLEEEIREETHSNANSNLNVEFEAE